MFAEAFHGLQQNLRTLVLYIGLATAYQSAFLFGHHTLILPIEETLDPVYLNVYAFSTTILHALCWAVLQSICFARLGRKIDQPFWKISGDWESLKRFFKLWFLLDLGALTLLSVAEKLASGMDDESLAKMTICFALGAAVTAAPFGIAVMFHGRFGQEEVRAALSTLVAQLPRAALVVLMAFFVAMFLIDIRFSENFAIGLAPLLYIVDAYVDCLIFCCIWYLCMLNRDEDTEDIDFDF
jgi:hypothetical protein